MQTVRKEWHAVITPLPDPTIRTAIEWYKNVVRKLSPHAADGMSQDEYKYLQQAWGKIVDDLAKKEQLPAGTLIYLVDNIANSEMQLLATAEAESIEALSEARAVANQIGVESE